MARFAHIADVHLGAFRDPLLRERNVRAFETAMAEAARRNVDFAIIAGDLFDISIPDLTVVQRAVRAMRAFGKPVYAVYGSHDYSPTQTSVIDVLNEAGVLTKVSSGAYADENADKTPAQESGNAKHSANENPEANPASVAPRPKLVLDVLTDPKTGVKITGISARKLGLEKTYFRDLDTASLEALCGPKVFVFHCAIEDFKPSSLKRVDAVPLSVFPKGFDYYAGGHVHDRLLVEALGGKLVFTGPLSAADFHDLQELAKAPHGFYVVDVDAKTADFVPVDFGRVVALTLDANGMGAAAANEKLQALAQNAPACDVALLHMRGTLTEGKPSEVDTGAARKILLEKSASVYVNNALAAAEREAVFVDAEKPDEIAKKVFREMLADRDFSDALSGEKGTQKALALLEALRTENPGETKKRFEDVLAERAKKVLNIAP